MKLTLICCLAAMLVISVTSDCTHDGKVIKEGTTYNPDDCIRCHCAAGELKCMEIICGWPNCGPGVYPVFLPENCCPSCPA